MSDQRSDPDPARDGSDARCVLITPAALHWAMVTTRMVLGWERLCLALWVPACVVGGFVALALLDVLPQLPGWVHTTVLLMTAAALALVLNRGFRGLRWPVESEALRRLECHNGLAHRPLSTLRDRPATVDGERDDQQDRIWRQHCLGLAQRIGRLRVPVPRSVLATVDPLGVRAMVGVLLVATAAGSWGDWLPRLAAAVQPQLASRGSTVAAALDAWLVPPDYTGAAPIFLQRAGNGPGGSPDVPVTTIPISVPVGTTVLARVSGGSGSPTLTVNNIERPFSVVDGSHFQAEEVVRDGTVIAVDQGGRSLGHWAIVVLPNRSPDVAFSAEPSVSKDGRVRLEYTATDDYGLAGVTATVRLAPEAATAIVVGQGPLVLPLPLPGLRPKVVHGTSSHDLTASPWAGLPVRITLIATDGGGRTGLSAELPLVLPERPFANPIAQRIIAQRKALALGGDAARNGVAQSLSELSIAPEAYHGDFVVFLALRVAVAELVRDRTLGVLSSVRDLLWETALRLEDGEVSLAESDLRAAAAALADALDHNAAADEIRRRMDDLQTALDHFLDALDQQGQGNGPIAPESSEPPDTTPLILGRTDLDAMMRSLRDMTETGARDGARQALSNLRQVLEGLRTGATEPAQGPALEVLHQLQDLTARQRELLDRTFRQSEGSQPRGLGSNPTTQSPTHRNVPPASDQELLRHQLDAVMEKLGEINGDIPKPLGDAERSMREAELALRRGDVSGAADAETDAAEGLQRGLRGLGQALGLTGAAAGGASPGAATDPLGRLRPDFGLTDSSNVGVPEAPELLRAREILDELRRRAGQRDRSRQELDYIERLLRQF